MTGETQLAPEPAAEPATQAVRIVDREHHPISRGMIPENVLKVLYRLHRSGYKAYLCGGGVRDLLVGRQPKDFDLVTDAQPIEIRRLFRNSRIIGRRFRLVHVLFQESAVEVATFRRSPEQRADDELLVTDDNTFGTPEEDARRRDFTINGIFYNIADFTVLDYVGGLEDVERRLVRVIGDPDVRFREDPVRMLRAVEFASRLDFGIEEGTWRGITGHRAEILKASPVRVTEEILELLRRGWARDAFRLMVSSRLLEPLLPELYKLLSRDEAPHFWKMLEVLDRTVRAGRSVGDAVLFSVLLLPYVLDQVQREEARRGGRMKAGDTMLLLRELINPICTRMALPAGVRHQIEQTMETLWRLLDPPPDRRTQLRFAFREQFMDALALLELHAYSTGEHVAVHRLWSSIAARLRHHPMPEPVAQPRRRRRRRG